MSESESELENPFLLRAFRSAESCSAEAEDILDALDEAITDLQEDPELRELVVQVFAKADRLIDQCGAVAEEIRQLRLTYRASRSTSGLPPEIELLSETVARIKRRVVSASVMCASITRLASRLAKPLRDLLIMYEDPSPSCGKDQDMLAFTVKTKRALIESSHRNKNVHLRNIKCFSIACERREQYV